MGDPLRHIRSLAATAAVALVAAGSTMGLAGTAGAAASPKAVTVVVTPSEYSSTDYGSSTSFSVDVVEAANPATSVLRGTVTVYKRYAGSTDWVSVSTSTYAGTYFYEENTESAEYKVTYSGYTATSSYQSSYQAAESAPVTVNVTRGTKYIEINSKKACLQVGPLSAPYKNKPVTTYYKAGKSKKWKLAYSYKTDKKSRYCFKVKKYTKQTKKVSKKGPKLKATKTVYVKSGGMGKYADVYTFSS
ncbi:hypothetical protein [Nocardioides sp.]|uniref:hypothetical protein n=1 Tax=Nocardioides sp. TaxID=35761 RepID=UPI0039E4AFD5